MEGTDQHQYPRTLHHRGAGMFLTNGSVVNKRAKFTKWKNAPNLWNQSRIKSSTALPQGELVLDLAKDCARQATATVVAATSPTARKRIGTEYRGR